MGDMALMPKICEKFTILGDFWWFLGPLGPDITPYTTPGTQWMIVLPFGHSIMYIPMRNPIHCIRIMAVMAKMC